jgi:cobalt/nickel transport system ATP-binding protein
MGPDVLLLDEPAGGLDDEAAARLVCVLSELPHAMIVVSHERSFREAVTEYTLRLHDGRIETV